MTNHTHLDEQDLLKMISISAEYVKVLAYHARVCKKIADNDKLTNEELLAMFLDYLETVNASAHNLKGRFFGDENLKATGPAGEA
jgi:hypothetical protein